MSSLNLCIHQQGEEKGVPQHLYKKRVDNTTCKVCIKTFNSIEERKKHTKWCKVETKCKTCFQKCADFASIHSFHLHCLLCKGGLYQCPFCDDEIFTRDNYKKCQCHFE